MAASVSPNRERVRELLRADPTMTDREIARVAGVSHPTVACVRREDPAWMRPAKAGSGGGGNLRAQLDKALADLDFYRHVLDDMVPGRIYLVSPERVPLDVTDDYVPRPVEEQAEDVEEARPRFAALRGSGGRHRRSLAD